tara:strand:- start:140 stop:472 length:333 start_codon:yes stop_codon:yes gene_type:complete
MEVSTTFCQNCKKEVDVNEVKYIAKDDNTFDVICKNCDEIPEQSKKEVTLNPEKVKYFCSRCRFSFARNPKNLVKCPYCGKEDKVMEDNRDIKKIISEVSQPDFDEGRLF